MRRAVLAHRPHRRAKPRGLSRLAGDQRHAAPRLGGTCLAIACAAALDAREVLAPQFSSTTIGITVNRSGAEDLHHAPVNGLQARRRA